MKLKYYLRGLGIGIAVTAIIMSFTRQPEKLTDTQIKARARELGMVEKSVLADFKMEESFVEEQEDIRETAGEADLMEADENIINNDENVIDNAADDTDTTVDNEGIADDKDSTVNRENPEKDKNKEVEVIVEKYIVISVVGGSGSEVVCQKLFEAGLIDSEVEYNRFLIENGYDKSLRAGHHEIPVGATEEEMARILCGLQ